MAPANPFLMTEPPLWVGAMAAYPYSGALAQRYTVVSKFGDVVRLWEPAQNGEIIKLPRAFCPPPKEGTDKRAWQSRTPLPCNIVPRTEEQKDSIARMEELILDGESFCVKAPTGSGKTVMGIAALCKVGVQTLIVVPKEDLFDMWLSELVKFGVPTEKIGMVRQDKYAVSGKQVVVAMLHSLAVPGKYPEWFKSWPGLTLYDECLHPSQEILTRGGWVPAADVTQDHMVAQYDADTDEVTFAHPLKLIAKPFSGNLVHVTGPGYDLMVTPGHEQPHLRKTDAGWARKRLSWETLPVNGRIALPVSATGLGDQPITPMERVWLMFQADGHHLSTAKKSGLHVLRFSFRKPRKIERCTALLEAAGIPYRASVNARGDTNITCHVTELPSKDLTTWVTYDRGPAFNEAVLYEVLHWDGWSTEDGAKYYQSTHAQNVGVIKTLAVLCAYPATEVAYPPRSPKHAPMRRVRWQSKKTHCQVGGWSREETPYEGMVYCVRMPKGNIVVRRNGHIAITGNCHRLPTDTFTKVAAMFSSKVRVGLSATHERADGLDLIVRGHIGPIRVEIKQEQMIPKVLIYKTAWTVPRWSKSDPVTGQRKLVKAPHSPGKATHIIVKMCKDMERNVALAENTVAALEKGRQVVFFSEIIEHLETMQSLFMGRGIRSRDMAYYIGGMSKEDREAAAHRQLLLGTWAMFKEGTNIPTLDTAVLATPRADVVQAVGRIRRIHENKKFPAVMDYVDEDSPVFLGYANKRRAWYAKLGCEIVDMN